MKNKHIISSFLLIITVIFSVGCNKEEVGDGTVPEIVILGLNPTYWALDIPYVDAGAVAFDVTTEGDTVDITDKIVVTDNVNVNEIGNYDVLYNVTDKSGVSAEVKTRDVNVVLGK